jgi:protein-S-isoprenylcysteine O-methyltransferase Ste14
MKFFEMRIPPVAVFLICAIVMYLVQRSAYTFEIELLYRMILIAPLALFGAYVALMGVVQFKNAQTTVNPFTPGKSSVLVTSGVYSWSRNPMYLGLLCYLLALFVYFAAPIALVGPALFKIYMNRFQIQTEERYLTQIFGETYIIYTSSVNRWIGNK